MLTSGKARGEGSNPAVGTIFPIFITHHDTGCCDQDPVLAELVLDRHLNMVVDVCI